MTAVGLGQQGAQAVGPVRVSVVPNIFMISLTFFRNSILMVPMAQWVGQQGSEVVGPGSNLGRAKYFYDFTDICQKFQWFPWHSG